MVGSMHLFVVLFGGLVVLICVLRIICVMSYGI